MESGENVNKHTTAVTHSYWETHTQKNKQGEEEEKDGNMGKRCRKKNERRERETGAKMMERDTDTSRKTVKSPPQTNKYTARVDCFICQHSH